MNRSRTAAVAVLGFRIAYGAGLLVAPRPLTRRWLGPAAVMITAPRHPLGR